MAGRRDRGGDRGELAGPDGQFECRLRPAAPRDKPFLFELHRRTMRELIDRTWGWQEGWQRRDFEIRFARCDVSIIEADGRDAGALWLQSPPEFVYVADIQVLPEFQGRGIGTRILQRVIADAARRALPVELSVLDTNTRARRLYERLGFRIVEEGQPFVRMRHDDSIPR